MNERDDGQEQNEYEQRAGRGVSQKLCEYKRKDEKREIQNTAGQ
jgi:hypothetical protein